ncbi:MAG: ComEC/Rec2 family competence protein [Clostridiaceae bacterium]
MKRPMILLVLSYVVGLVSALIILEENYPIAVLVIFGYFLLVWLNENVKVLILCLIVTFLGSINFFGYYKIDYTSATQSTIRVLEDRSTYFKVKHDGRLYVLLKNERLSKYSIEEGSLIEASFNIERNMELYKGIIGTIDIASKPKVTKDFLSHLSSGRLWLYKQFSPVLGKDRASVVLGLCFGSTKYIDDSTINSFKGLGIIHVISVSGFHIVLLYSLFKSVFGKKGSLILVFFFVIFTGAQGATVRAFLMLFILSLSQIFHKNYDSLTALCLSALIILMIKPFLITDLGFNLSFLSTLGIIIFNKKINRALYRFPNKIRASLSLTISSQLIVFPYGSLVLKTFSTGFILGNLIIIPIYTAIIYVSLISIIFIKVPYLFSLINKINILLFGISDSWFYLLSRLNLSETAVSEEIVLMYTTLFITFILIKNNKVKYRLLPVFLLPAILLFNYRFLPFVQVIDMGNTRYIEACYKRDRYFFTIGKGDSLREKLKNYPGNKKIMSVKNNKYILKLGNTRIKITPYHHGKKAVILKIFLKDSDATSVHCDIINMDKEDTSYDFYRREKLISYSSLGNHIIIINKDGGPQVVRYRQTRK